MMKIRLIPFAFEVLLGLTLLTNIIACSSLDTRRDGSPVEETRIDLDGLQHSLAMERPVTDLGHEEKSFDTCSAGYGFSSSHECQRKHLSIVQIQLQCRDSEGTVSSVDYLLTPIHSNRVRWDLAGESGILATDSEGFGQVRVISSQSTKNQKLRLTVNGKFLLVTASEARRIVTPQSWCE